VLGYLKSYPYSDGFGWGSYRECCLENKSDPAFDSPSTPSNQVEFDKPSELLKKENGMFRSLIDESGDRDLLYAMANSGKTPGTTTHQSE
jgi:hypothetical protein